jgi:hypothetical protein
LFTVEREGTVTLYDRVMAADYIDKVVQFTSLEEYQHMHVTTWDA